MSVAKIKLTLGWISWRIAFLAKVGDAFSEEQKQAQKNTHT